MCYFFWNTVYVQWTLAVYHPPLSLLEAHCAHVFFSVALFLATLNIHSINNLCPVIFYTDDVLIQTCMRWSGFCCYFGVNSEYLFMWSFSEMSVEFLSMMFELLGLLKYIKLGWMKWCETYQYGNYLYEQTSHGLWRSAGFNMCTHNHCVSLGDFHPYT